MKLRTDFVTNSSSSSFVIAYKEPEDELHALVLDVFLDTANDCGSTPADRVSDLQSLESMILRWYSWMGKQTVEEIVEDDPEAARIYLKARKALSDGFTVAYKSISYYDETLRRLSDMLVSSGNMIILYDEEE